MACWLKGLFLDIEPGLICRVSGVMLDLISLFRAAIKLKWKAHRRRFIGFGVSFVLRLAETMGWHTHINLVYK